MDGEYEDAFRQQMQAVSRYPERLEGTSAQAVHPSSSDEPTFHASTILLSYPRAYWVYHDGFYGEGTVLIAVHAVVFRMGVELRRVAKWIRQGR